MDVSNLQPMSFDWLGDMHAMWTASERLTKVWGLQMGLRPFPCNIISTLEKDVKSYMEVKEIRGHGCTSKNVKQLEPATHCFLETGGD